MPFGLLLFIFLALLFAFFKAVFPPLGWVFLILLLVVMYLITADVVGQKITFYGTLTVVTLLLLGKCVGGGEAPPEINAKPATSHPDPAEQIPTKTGDIAPKEEESMHIPLGCEAHAMRVNYMVILDEYAKGGSNESTARRVSKMLEEDNATLIERKCPGYIQIQANDFYLFNPPPRLTSVEFNKRYKLLAECENIYTKLKGIETKLDKMDRGSAALISDLVKLNNSIVDLKCPPFLKEKIKNHTFQIRPSQTATSP